MTDHEYDIWDYIGMTLLFLIMYVLPPTAVVLIWGWEFLAQLVVLFIIGFFIGSMAGA